MKRIIYLIVFGMMLFSGSILAQSLPITQTDWSGGKGQIDWSDSTKFNGVYGVDYSVPGQLTINPNEPGYAYDMFVFDNRLFVSRTYGVFEYNFTNAEWSLSLALNMFTKNMFVKDDTLYGVGSLDLYKFHDDGVDYGIGANGWEIVPRTGLPSEFQFMKGCVFNGEIYISGVMWTTSSSGGRVYKLTDSGWIQVGQQIENSVTSLAVYNAELFAGTHWSGKVYKLTNGNWTYTNYSSGMSIIDMYVWNGKLYLGSQTSSQKSGYISSYDGTSFTQLYNGPGITKIRAASSKLYFGGMGSKTVYQYDGTSFSQFSSIAGTAGAIGAIAVNGDDVYFAGGYNLAYEYVDATIYKNTAALAAPMAGILTSSLVTLDSAQVWGNLSFNASSPAGTGVSVLTRGKETAEDWTGKIWRQAENNTDSKLKTQQGYFAVLLWHTGGTSTPEFYDITIGGEVPAKLEIKDVIIKYKAHNAVTVLWRTTLPASGFVFYGDEPGNYPEEIMEGTDLNENHRIEIENLEEGKTYYLIIDQSDKDWNNVRSDEYSFVAGDMVTNGPEITSIIDVPEDQGGWVYINWAMDPLDRDGVGEITQYGVWELKGEEYISHGSLPAVHMENYSFLTHTYADSTSSGIYWSKFMITAHTLNTNQVFMSPVDSGYSVDNIFPAAPANLMGTVNGASSVALTWDESFDEDFGFCKIYRIEGTTFSAENAEVVGYTEKYEFSDVNISADKNYSYAVSFVDAHGNEGNLSESISVSVTVVENSGLPKKFNLEQNYPNPFNPVTTIKYSIPESSGEINSVVIKIYDALGGEVKTLVNEPKAPGNYNVEFNAEGLSSGIYLYRITTGKFTAVRKMILSK